MTPGYIGYIPGMTPSWLAISIFRRLQRLLAALADSRPIVFATSAQSMPPAAPSGIFCFSMAKRSVTVSSAAGIFAICLVSDRWFGMNWYQRASKTGESCGTRVVREVNVVVVVVREKLVLKGDIGGFVNWAS